MWPAFIAWIYVFWVLEFLFNETRVVDLDVQVFANKKGLEEFRGFSCLLCCSGLSGMSYEIIDLKTPVWNN